MKHLRKMMALVMTLIMSFSMANTAFAADGDFTGTAESTISVSELESGDGAVYYQLIERNATTGEWKLTADYGVALADLVDGVNSDEAATIANAINSANPAIPASDMSVDTDSGIATASVQPGMYYVFVTPGATNDIIYNPIFVSADYHEGGNTIAATTEYEDKAVAKKVPVTLTKTMDHSVDKDVKIDQEIPFTVTTNIPSYTDAYSKKEFSITDTLDPGLALTKESVSVTVAGDTDLADPTDYHVSENADGSGYTVTFTESYLDGIVGNPAVTITYKATVTTEALDNVTEFDNNVTLNYTHNVDGNSKEITKKTRHYTFSIDAHLLGSTGSETITEDFVKVAVDENGDPVYITDEATRRVIDNGDHTVSALKGAKFELKGVTDSSVKFDNIETNINGEISVYGLDAGIYTLQEKSAPAGFVMDSTLYYVEIAPEYENDGDGVPYLLSYDIRFATSQDALANSTVKTYVMTNNATTKTVTEIKGEDITGVDTQIQNTKGAQLPSTGGIGTTIFYIVGGLMVAGAVVFLLTKRRVAGNE
jgi:fimbrial isopeptide formation D2 family protein/LPXTG-motif cell wall-anchored protein